MTERDGVTLIDMENERITKFCDIKSIQTPENLDDLIAQLHEVFAEDKVNVDYVHRLMESYVSNKKDWKKFAKFDPHR